MVKLNLSSDPQCTCDATGYMHDSDCDLWHDVDFAHGSAEWDPTSERLISVAEVLEKLQKEEEDEEDYYLEYPQPLLELNDTYGCPEPEPLNIHGVPKNVMSLCKELRAWIDMELYDMWDKTYVEDGGTIECFCSERSEKFLCGNCGVVRLTLDSKWRRTTERYDDELGYTAKDYFCPNKPQCNKMICNDCGMQFATANEFRDLTLPDKVCTWWRRNLPHSGGTTTYGGGFAKTWCSHHQDEVTLPSGKKFYLSESKWSSTKKDEENKFVPDIHIMLASSQRPEIIAYFIDWADHGLPYVPFDQVVAFMDQTLKQSGDGLKVEFGCMGAHGRTGTFLAGLYIRDHTAEELADVTADDVIKWVRKNHCEEAIEGATQEWYIDCLLHHRRDQPSPERPKPPPPKPVKNTGQGQLSVAGTTTKTTTASSLHRTPKMRIGYKPEDLNSLYVYCWGDTSYVDEVFRQQYVLLKPLPDDYQKIDRTKPLIFHPVQDADGGSKEEKTSLPPAS